MKRKRGKPQYPAATVALYGPDDRHATKVVVSIVLNPTSDPGPMRKWLSGFTDVRANQQVGKEIQAFLKEHGVRSVITTDRILGCAHEEGKDYPEGVKCPLCTFWSKRNRFTHEVED